MLYKVQLPVVQILPVPLCYIARKVCTHDKTHILQVIAMETAKFL